MAIKNNFPEFADEWVFKPRKNIPLKDQIICTYDNNSLLNVRKIYTNSIYFGVIWTTVNSSGDICHNFRCKDKGFSEDIVENKQSFIDFFKDTLSSDTTRIFERSETSTYIQPNFLQEYNVNFVLDKDGNYFATTAILNNANIRDLYGATTDKVHAENIKYSGISIFNRFPTEEEVKTYVIDKHLNVLSANFITRVNTVYSQIKVYHKSEI